MADKKYITRAQLDAIAAGLRKLKKKEEERFSMKGGIKLISATITDALTKGFDYGELATIIEREHNIEIKADTLRSYHKAAIAPDDDRKNADDTKESLGASDKSSDKQVPRPTPGSEPPATNTNGGKFIKDPDV